MVGGDGTWSAQSGTTNWTNAAGTSASAWGQGGVAVFGGNAGTVTIAGGTPPQAAGLEFLTSGYNLVGQTQMRMLDLVALAPGAVPKIAVASGTATISALLVGSDGFEKTGAGTLVLTRANTISGATVSEGTLELRGAGGVAGTMIVASGATLVADPGATGGASQGLTVSGGGTFQLTADGTTI